MLIPALKINNNNNNNKNNNINNNDQWLCSYLDQAKVLSLNSLKMVVFTMTPVDGDIKDAVVIIEFPLSSLSTAFVVNIIEVLKIMIYQYLKDNDILPVRQERQQSK